MSVFMLLFRFLLVGYPGHLVCHLLDSSSFVHVLLHHTCSDIEWASRRPTRSTCLYVKSRQHMILGLYQGWRSRLHS